MVGSDYQRSDGAPGKVPRVGGNLLASLFFLFFFGMGSAFTVLMVVELGRGLRQRAWQSVPCKIVASEVQDRRDSDKPYVFTVSYVYEYAHRTYSGSVYERNYKASETYSQARKLAQKYPVGLATFCYVNPQMPADAVLKRDSLLFALFLFIPLVFVAIGAGGLYFTWRPRRDEARPLADASIRSRVKPQLLSLVLLGIFGAAGLGMFYPLGIKPIAETIDAQSWAATPCWVLRAEVRSHSGDDGPTYSVYVLYQYQFGGKTYRSDRYSFVGGSSSGYDRKMNVVRQYRSATNPVCYVNPQDPSQAVLKRGLHAGLLIALVPLAFMLLGFGGIYAVMRGKPQAAADNASVLRLTGSGSAILRPMHPPWARLAGAILIAAFWDGIVAVFVVDMIEGFRHGHPSWFLVLFLVPFEIVGIGLLALVAHQFLALFNPRLKLALSAAAIPLGGTAELQWVIAGRVSRIQEFTATLRGVEEATSYESDGSGESTRHLNKNTFYEMELLRTFNPEEMAAGSVGFALPRDTMYSFETKENKIVWSIDVHGRIAWWPDVKESFKLAVVPAKG